MKNTVILLGTALIAVTTLTACATSALMQEVEKIDALLGEEPTKSHTLTRMGQPVNRTPLPNQGECLQYIRPIGGENQPFAIGFDKNGKFLDMFYDTCAEAIKLGTFSKPASQ